ncbi:MAG TPA: protease modulator HflC [Rhodopila sp.]|uniref:protease modulator HflC n=1 Tax=Rhodopila sp. TaxID=2480087 RepID=UPI002D13D12A|nr:protease modulator HflC [Rhodopila sp.]HVY16914.1 protease modulator HflC [Rhodopila sp.]
MNTTRSRQTVRLTLRLTLAGAVVAAAAAASTIVMVGPGQAVVVTEFGRPVKVLTHPGLAWKIPAPVEQTIPVDLRLRTTSSGLQDVGTKEGLRILVQAYVAWQVDDDPLHVEQFLRAGHSDPDDTARRLRSFIGSTLQVTASNFNLTDLINIAPSRARFADFERQLQANLYKQVLDTYGIRIVETGVERLSLPAETLAATVARMRTERETVAAQRTAEGLRKASAIRSDAARDAKLIAAKADEQVAEIEAQGREKAAAIHAKAYVLDPQLYTMLRSLDTLGAIVGPKTRVILRTDSEPFKALVQALPAAGTAAAPTPAPTDRPPGPRVLSSLQWNGQWLPIR